MLYIILHQTGEGYCAAHCVDGAGGGRGSLRAPAGVSAQRRRAPHGDTRVYHRCPVPGSLARDTIDLAGPLWQQLGRGALGYFGEVAGDWCDGVAGRWDGWRHFRGMDVLAPGTGGSG